MKHLFSNEALKCLIEAGWSQERKLNQIKIIQQLVNEGYKTFPKALDFLVNFEDLKIIFFNKKTKQQDDFNFSLKKAFDLEIPERIYEDYMPRINNTLICPIGTAYRDHFVLMIDFNGSIYGAYDDFLVKIGNNYIEAINSIINDDDFVEIK